MFVGISWLYQIFGYISLLSLFQIFLYLNTLFHFSDSYQAVAYIEASALIYQDGKVSSFFFFAFAS